MLTSGIISLFLVLFSSISILLFKKQIKKYSFKYPFIIYLISIFCLLYFLIARYIPDIIDLIKYQKINNNLNDENYLKSVYLSKALLLDACPFIAMFLPLSIFINKQMSIAKYLAPLGIIGSCVTIFGQVIWDDISMNEYIKYLFIGENAENRLYFMMHWINLLLSLYVLVLCKYFNLKDLIFTFAFYIAWFIYMIIFILGFNIKYNATGLVINDWLDPIYGEYHKVYNFWKLPYPIITIFWYFIAILVNYLIIGIKNFSLIKNGFHNIKAHRY